MSKSWWLHGLQHARLPWLPLSPRVDSGSCSLIWRCYATISISFTPFSSRLQPFPASTSFQWVGTSNQVARVLELQHQSLQWIFRVASFRIDGFMSFLSKGLSRVFSNTTVQSINSSVLSLLYGPTLTSIHDCWKNHHSFGYVHPVSAKWCLLWILIYLFKRKCRGQGFIE